MQHLRRSLQRLCLGLALVLATAAATAQINGFYRFPTLHGEQVWFTAEGDLWRVGSAGGQAERITTHPSAETRPAVSPDGRWLAFTGAYEGPTEAYVMAVAGGVPKRLTWGGESPLVTGWTPAGEVLVVAPAEDGQLDRQLYAIDPATLGRRTLPVAQASDGAVSADGKRLYFTRNGLINDNVRAYRGGAMARIWSLPLDSNAEAQPLLDAQANTRRPMPYGSARGDTRIAFLSDRSGTLNVWSVDAQGGDARQHTRHAGGDVRYASIDGARVVYALGADLRIVDLANDADRALPITLGGDFDPQRTRWVKQPQPFFSAAGIAPNGERVVLTVRGHVATQGVGTLRRAELPVPAGTRCRDAVFGADNRTVFALCDTSGEVEAWRFAANGSGVPVQLTRGGTALRLGLFPSPDGQWLAHFDKNSRLTLTALTPAGGGESRVIDTPRFESDPVLAWSPDSRALVLVRPTSNGDRPQLLLYTLVDAKLQVLTSDRYASASPTFTPDGKWLYFLSDRAFASLAKSPWGDRNTGPYFDRRTRVYALALQPGLRFPFEPHDELEPPAPGGDTPPVTTTATAIVDAPSGAASASVTVQTKPAAKPAKPGTPLPAIVADGLAQRLHEVPLAAGNYTRLGTDGKRLYLLEADSTPEAHTSLRTLAIENTDPQPELLAPEVKAFALTPDGKKLMLVRSAKGDAVGDILLVDAAPKLPSDLGKNQVRWADWQIAVDPRAEWRQMFDDAWRLHRDYFFDTGMLGVDWAAARRRHEPLLARVTDRAELNELLAQMVSELHTLHSQVYTRDLRKGPDNIGAAGLGARFAKVAEGFRIERIYRSDPELPSEAAPLAQARVAAGEIVTAVNGRSAAGVADLSELLRGQAGRQLLLTLKRAGAPPHDVVVTPVDAEREHQLAEGDWEAGRAQRVLAQGGGRIGYLRLRAMGEADIATFAREFYANVDRDGLIIDVRGNEGGNIDSWVLEKLLRRAWAFWQPRTPPNSPPYPNMQNTFRGHLAVLIDENTYSDGETFSEGVKRLQLGPLIGKRTSGAGVWLSDRNALLDNGLMRAGETAQLALDGSRLIEGVGVTPDIEVDNPPRATFNGADAQLDAAIEHLKRRIAEQPVAVPLPPKR